MFARGNYSKVEQKDGTTSLINDGDARAVSVGSFSSFDFDEEFEVLVKAYMRDMNYTTVNSAAINIVHSLINAGLVALPFTTQEAGIPLFIVSFVIMSILSSYTSIMVVAMANEQKVRTLEDLADCAFGRKGFLAVSLCQLLYSFSLMAVTLDIWADIMSDVFNELDWGGWLFQTRNGQVIFGALLVFPFCLLKKSMSSLRWTSYVSVFAAIGALVAVAATYVTETSVSGSIFSHKSMRETSQPKSQWWSVIFLSVFCYSCNQKVFTIYSSLRRRSTERWQTATIRSSVAITIIYILFGVTGYVSKYRKEIFLDNFNFFLSNEDERKEVFDPARAVVAFCLLITMPVDCLVCATTWRRFYSKYVGKYNYNAEGEYREVTCCDVVYAPLSSASLQEGEDEEEPGERAQQEQQQQQQRDMLPSAKQVENPHHNHTEFSSSEDDDEENNNMDLNEASAAGAVLLPPKISGKGANSDYFTSPSQRSMSKRKRFRRSRSSRKQTSSSSVRFENSYSSSGAWSFFRSLLAPDASQSLHSKGRSGTGSSGREDSMDKHTASQTLSIEDARLSALRESFQEGDIFNGNSNSPPRSVTQPTQPIMINSANNNNSSGHNRWNSTGSNSQAPLSRTSTSQHGNPISSISSGKGGGSGAPGQNPSLTNTANITDGRESSFDQQMYGELLEDDVSICPTRNEFVPTFFLWLATVGLCSIAAHWMYIAAIFSVATTLFLTFIYPSLMYFRLGLLSDYQAMPLFGEIVPNRAYMTVIKYLGIALLIFDVLLMICLIATGQNVIRNES